MLTKKDHDVHSTNATNDNDWGSENISEETFSDLLTLSDFKEEKKFVRSNRKPNLNVARKFEKKDFKKSIYDPISSSDDEEICDVDKASELKQEHNQNLPMGRGFVVQKFNSLRKVGDSSVDEITNDIREIYPHGNSDDVIIAKLNKSPVKHVPDKRRGKFRSNYEQFQAFEDDNSPSASSSSYGPYIPKYEQKPNFSDANEFPSLAGGKKKQGFRKDNVTTSTSGFNRKFKPAKKLNLKDATQFPNL